MSTAAPSNLEDRVTAVLLGTALGDALGLACEGLSAKRIKQRFGRVVDFRVLGKLGVLSDDTEQAALMAQSLAWARLGNPEEFDRAALKHFRHALIGWFWRFPFGIGMGTLKSCLKLTVGFKTGIASAGNGAVMRAPIVGLLVDEPAHRLALGASLARISHKDDRAVAGALFAAELARACAEGSVSNLGEMASGVVARVFDGFEEGSNAHALRERLEVALGLIEAGESLELAAATLGSTGFVNHSLPLALFCFLRGANQEVLDVLSDTIAVGGDTDTNAAIVGAWLGAHRGLSALPVGLLSRLQPGPFGRAHLEALGTSLACSRRPPRYSWLLALGRNLALFPVILAHGLRRLVPF